MRRRSFLSLLSGAAATSITAWPAAADSHSSCSSPLARQDGWTVAFADDEKLVDHSALCRMVDRLAASDSNIHAVVVARGGRLAFEQYLKGNDEIPGRLFGKRVEAVTFDADTLHNVKSVSKSVASLVIGIAIDQGFIKSVDQPILDFFPDLSDLRSAERDRILLVHALTMSMGLDWVEATPDTGDFRNDEARMNMAWDPCRFVLTRPIKAPAGQTFFYNTGTLMLLSAIVHKATGRPLDEFARTTLFEPLGIADFTWARFRGETDAGGGLRMRPRDMAKIGQLVLAGGRWNDRQVVSKSWIETSTTPKLNAIEGMSYGYLWWLGNARINGRGDRWIGALGRGGQSIRIVSDLDLVVAVTAGYYQDYSPRAFQLQYDVFRDVLRAVS